MPTILVVDDDATVRDVVVQYLRQAGYATLEATDGPSAVTAAAEAPDAIILDLMLPGFDGLEAYRRLRAAGCTAPVLMLTARDDEAQRILGLELGADDYVTKPFSPRELTLRVQAVLRRQHPTPSATSDIIEHGRVRLDPAARTVHLSGQPTTLTTREYDLLHHLMAHPGHALTRTDLMNRVWGWEYGDETTVTVHIRRLREKIEPDASAPRYIVTVWRVGYRWDGHQTDA